MREATKLYKYTLIPESVMKKKGDILKEVLSEIKPEKDIPEVHLFLNKLNSSLKKNRLKAKAVFGGSFAKDTWLKGDLDVDIFIKFNLKYKEDDLSALLRKALKRFAYELIHGSRDYFWIRNKIKYELIPVLDIKKPRDAKNVTDFSPLHTAWVNKNGKSLKDDVRLAKKFMKAQGVYGAESYIKGFSGHVVDILVIYYKGFINLLKAALKWKEKQVIDYYKAHKNQALLRLNLSKTQGPLIVVDPVQPGRNAAAALSCEKFELFVKSAKSFLRAPSKKFFWEKEIKPEELKGNVIILKATAKEGKEDVVGAKLLKSFEFVKNRLEEFKVLKSGWLWDKKNDAVFWYQLKEKALPETLARQGPPLRLKEAVERFKQQHKKTFVKGNRIFAKVKREHTAAENIIKVLLKDPYLKEKVKKCYLK